MADNYLKNYNWILLVDDDMISNFVTYSLLRSLDSSVKIDVVYNGVEAIDFIKLNDNGPGLIMVDINMPIMDGFKFVENLLKTFPDRKIEIIFLSTSLHCKDLDMIDFYNAKFINKPITKVKLLATNNWSKLING